MLGGCPVFDINGYVRGGGNGPTEVPTVQERHHLAGQSPSSRTNAAGAMRATALLFLLSLGVQMTAVCAGEAEEPIACESPHQVASVAMAVTDSCEEGGEDSGAVSGGFRLAEHCSAGCAAVFLPWFGEGRGTCFTALDLDEMAEQTFTAFASVCATENSGVDICRGRSSSGRVIARNQH
eukprot:SAG22_NODE_544_length_9280_cov_9.545148_4_plen_180_part_00